MTSTDHTYRIPSTRGWERTITGRVLLSVLMLLTCLSILPSPATAQMIPNEEWHITVVDSAGDVGLSSSLAVVNGQPAISYFDQTNFNFALKYAWTQNGANESSIVLGLWVGTPR